MPYRPVERIVTVEFVRDPHRKREYEVRTTPEQVVVRYGDTVVWDVQGLTPAQADKVSFGKFDLLEPAARVTSGKKGLLPIRGKSLLDSVAGVTPPKKGVKAANRRSLATLEARPAELGFYKYDIMFDGHTIIDPEMEIRGPKGG